MVNAKWNDDLLHLVFLPGMSIFRRQVRIPRCALVTVFIGACVVANIYRAATQGIVYDEAASYLIFMGGSVERVFTWYNANNHVLFTLLSKLSTETFGVSEFFLRLPAVMAGIGYLVVAGLLTRRASSDSRIFVLALVVLALNPLVFDFLSAARGYGLALFFFALALLLLSRDQQRRPWILVSLSLGAAICSNLTFIFPAVAVWITASVIALREQSVSIRSPELLARFWLPGTLGAAAFLAVPLREASRAHFSFGAESLMETASSLVTLSVNHHPTWWNQTWAATGLARVLVWAAVFNAFAVSALTLVRVQHWWRAPFVSDATSRLHVLLGGSFVLTLVVLVVAHNVAGVLYPKERTGLYLIVLSVLCLASLVASSRHRAIRWWAVVNLTILTVTSLEQLTVDGYGSWWYDAGSRRIAEFIASQSARHGRMLRVATTQYSYQPALEFYRVIRFPDRMASVADGFDPARVGEFDVLVVDEEDTARLPEGWQQTYVDRVSRARVFAFPTSMGGQPTGPRK